MLDTKTNNTHEIEKYHVKPQNLRTGWQLEKAKKYKLFENNNSKK